MDFVRRWSEATEIGAGRFVGWLGVGGSKFYDWRERNGRVNEHNGWVPRDFWLEDWEKQAIIGFHLKNPLEGYRRVTFMMLDSDIVAVSPGKGGVIRPGTPLSLEDARSWLRCRSPNAGTSLRLRGSLPGALHHSHFATSALSLARTDRRSHAKLQPTGHFRRARRLLVHR